MGYTPQNTPHPGIGTAWLGTFPQKHQLPLLDIRVTCYRVLVDSEPIPGRESEDQLIEQTFSLENNVVEALREKYKDPAKLRAIRAIGAFISNGMSRNEACILSFVEPDHFTALMAADSVVARFVLFKETVYKARLMRTVTLKGTEGRSEKSAGWLLERRFREEFGKNADPERPQNRDALEEGIDFVRKNGDSVPIVARTLPEGSVRDITPSSPVMGQNNPPVA